MWLEEGVWLYLSEVFDVVAENARPACLLNLAHLGVTEAVRLIGVVVKVSVKEKERVSVKGECEYGTGAFSWYGAH